MVKQIFVNLPVNDLDKSIAFFSKLGFTFNPRFTDKNATCMIISENIFIMLLVTDFFKTFTKKEIADAKKSTEVILSLQVESKEMVDDKVQRAVQAGASTPNEPKDHGWMYQWGFADLDGHLWEVFCMDETKMPKNT